MLATLLESRGRSPRRRVAAFASIIAHTILLLALVMARAQGSSEGTTKPVATSVVYFAPKQPPARRDMSRIPTRTQRGVAFPRIPTFVVPEDVVIGDVTPPSPIGLIVPWFPAPGSFGRDTLTLRGRAPDEVLTALAVDQPVEVVPGQRPPRYPTVFERAGVAGHVTAQFVVDTIGRVERGSIDIQHATHPEFARAVQERLAALRFVPARARGRVVRQLVEQRFHFEVVRR